MVVCSDERFRDFLPDAEGMTEGGHSPLAGLLIFAIAAVFASLITWAALAEVEQVVQAAGRVEPAGRVKLINHPDGGRVVAIHVEEGQSVAPGAPLVTFDADQIQAQVDDLKSRFLLKVVEVARLQAEIAEGEVEIEPEVVAAWPALVREQLDLLKGREQAQASRVEVMERSIEQRAADIDSMGAELGRLANRRALLAKQIDAIRSLTEQGLYPRLRMVEQERLLSDTIGEIAKARQRRRATEAALAEAKGRRDAMIREWRSRVLTELAGAKAERDRLAAALKAEEARFARLVVRSPVAGIVQDLQVTAVNQSVGSNQPLMKVVPTGAGITVGLKIANEDIGYVRPGLDAKVKVRAYDFLRFGVLAGNVERIAADANRDAGTGQLSYTVTVKTSETELGPGLKVVPGMAVDVDLMVGKRTILSYLTDRILRVREDAFREG